MSHNASFKRRTFLYHLEHQIAAIHFLLHSKSFPTTPHTPKSLLKSRSYDLNKLEKKKKQLSKDCHDKVLLCHDLAKNKAKIDFFVKKFYYVVIEFYYVTTKILTKPKTL